MSRILKWTVSKVQEESDKIHNKFIIHNVIRKPVGNKGVKATYIGIECKKCGHKNVVHLGSHINKKTDCKGCSMWTLQKVQNVSNKIHNNQFKIHNIKRNPIGKQGQVATVIQIECKICGYSSQTSIGNHINLESGCGGKCKPKANMNLQIEFLKSNSIIANQPYKLYFLKFIHKLDRETFYKIGKTKNIKTRYSCKDYSDYIIEEIDVIESTHLWVAEQEEKFINSFKKYKYKPKNKFGGWTECFKEEIYNVMFNKDK